MGYSDTFEFMLQRKQPGGVCRPTLSDGLSLPISREFDDHAQVTNKRLFHLGIQLFPRSCRLFFSSLQPINAIISLRLCKLFELQIVE